MTGYGKAELRTKAGKFTVEISSVNNRYLEITPRLPRQFLSLEYNLRELVGSKLNRGKINIYIGFDEPEDATGKYLINKKAFISYYQQLVAIKKEVKINSEIDLSTLVLLPEITKIENRDVDINVIWSHLKRVTAKALTDLIAMRRREGLAMAKDMNKRIAILAKKIPQIEKKTKQAVKKFREQLNKRLSELLDTSLLDKTRIEEEIIIMSEKTDVTEECTRFLSHLDQFKNTVKLNSSMGKKLNFILQELNREANTIASKCSDVNISSLIIDIKEEIEKLRELVQNVE